MTRARVTVSIGLIKRVKEALKDEKLTPAPALAARGVLPKDEESDPPNGLFNDASVIGMPLYLQAHSRPDLAFAVSQGARYNSPQSCRTRRH
jgi:hypothetical protein